MSGPRPSFRRTSCDDCADLIDEGEPIYFREGAKLCTRCAERDQLICPQCQGQKGEKYERCIHCEHKRVRRTVIR